MKFLNIERENDERAWLSMRRETIGASEVGIVLGLSQWKGARELAYDKIFGSDQIFLEQNARLNWGKVAEAAIIKQFDFCAKAQGTDFQIEPNTLTVQHPEHDFLIATPDFFGVNPKSLRKISGDIKTTSGSSEDWNVGLVPMSYQVQLDAQMACCGLEESLLVPMINGNPDLKPFEMGFNSERWEQQILPRLQDFISHVRAGTLPEPTAADTDFLLKHTDVNLTKTAALESDRYNMLAKELHQIQAMRRSLDKESRTLKIKQQEISNQFVAASGGAGTCLTSAGFRVRIKKVERSGYSVGDSSWFDLKVE